MNGNIPERERERVDEREREREREGERVEEREGREGIQHQCALPKLITCR